MAALVRLSRFHRGPADDRIRRNSVAPIRRGETRLTTLKLNPALLDGKIHGRREIGNRGHVNCALK